MSLARYHFCGIAGAGMNPLAQLVRSWGHDVQGSDRSFDQGKNAELAARLRGLGIRLYPQDGRAALDGVDRFVYSAAIEGDTPEVEAARTLGAELLPRPALLAEIVNRARPGVAIAGTSGKSTVTGMLAWVLREACVPATVLGGAALVGEGVAGCFAAGDREAPVVVEADESDGTLVGYRPGVGAVLNVTRDHVDLPRLRAQFATFASQCARLFVNAACPDAAALGRAVGAQTWGLVPDADAPVEVLRAGPQRAAGVLRLDGAKIALDVPQPGAHNVDNAAAALLVAAELGVAPERAAAALARFPGVARRFEVVGTSARGVRVVDDYAHNGAKIAAALAAAQAGADRILAVFQPHGFGPARFLRPELAELLPRVLRPRDRFCYAEIYYAGGTVVRDIASRDLVADLPAEMRCAYAADHAAVVRWVTAEARPGDTVLLMGARDPDLPRLARTVLAGL